MITKYTQFVNEANLFTTLKNMFGKLMQNVSDELKKPVEELTKKLDRSKDIEFSKKLLKDYLRIHNEDLKKSLDDSSTLNNIVKSVNDNLTAIYAALDASTRSLGENYSFEQMFGDSPQNIQKLFDKNEKNFNKNVDDFSRDLVVSLGKQYGFTKEDVLNTVSENKLYEEIDEVDPNIDQEQKQEIDNAQNDTEQVEDKAEDQNLKNLKDNIIKWFQNFIYKKVQDDLKKDKTKEQGTLQDKIDNMESTTNKDSVNRIVDKLTQVDKQTLIKVRDMLGLTKDESPL
jgi:alanyl-tRNA synthetase